MTMYTTKEEALAAVTRNGYALGYVSERLKDDKDVVLAADTQNGNALTYAPKRLQDDKDVVLAADRGSVLRCVHSGRFIPYGEALSNGEVYRAIALLDNIPDDLEAITISN